MAKSEAADVRIVYSPLDALEMARHNRDKKVIFLATGFETTAPHSALAVAQARRENLDNFSMLVPPAAAHLLIKYRGITCAGLPEMYD